MKNWSEGALQALFNRRRNEETLLYYMDAAGSFWRCETSGLATIASELETYCLTERSSVMKREI
jgi:hypothetical protein